MWSKSLGFYTKAAVVQWSHACFGGPRGLQAHGFESCPRSECRLGFLTRGNGFLADTTINLQLYSWKVPRKYQTEFNEDGRDRTASIHSCPCISSLHA
ncbi:hypothetical protein E2C01_016725 [Portunus trituberculatus]|uniref:Uncharacterized protein n=1 Tax=Portunus trituberculatus TaxID=210409 RepID=A0A5B7DRY4_PORTR|nr:hypothetical protein [Portunus trituberculatus]